MRIGGIEFDEKRVAEVVSFAINNSEIIRMKVSELLDRLRDVEHILDLAGREIGISFSWSTLNTFASLVSKQDILRSVRKYGVLKPIIVDSRWSVLVDGQSRVMTLLNLEPQELEKIVVRVQILPISCSENHENLIACLVVMYLSSVNKLMIAANPLKSIICEIDPSMCGIEGIAMKQEVEIGIEEYIDRVASALGLDRGELFRMFEQFATRLRERGARKIDQRVVLAVAAAYMLNLQCRLTPKNIRLLSRLLNVSRLQKRMEVMMEKMGIRVLSVRCGELAKQIGCPECSNARTPNELAACIKDRCMSSKRIDTRLLPGEVIEELEANR